MKYKKSLSKDLRQWLLVALNKAVPKAERVLVLGFPNVESSAISTANYIATHYSYPVSYVVSSSLKDDPTALLSPKIKVIKSDGGISNRLLYLIAILRSKYLFMTHGLFLTRFSKAQVVTNIWHGILYKKIGLLIGARAMPADVTVGTSPLTVKMFSRAFGVPEESIFVSGYPRNDLLLKAKAAKATIREQLSAYLKHAQQVLIWLPTFRKNIYKEAWEDGEEAGNPFYIPDFDVAAFNRILKESNAFCFVKPHPMAVKYTGNAELSNIIFIDDEWISTQGLTLYHLIGCTDLLISDVSSVVIDYLLMDQPILCVSTDFEAYRQSRGFYFEDIEDWLPGKVLDSQAAFFEALRVQLNGKEAEGWEAARRSALKEAFFTYSDARSTERLVQHVFNFNK